MNARLTLGKMEPKGALLTVRLLLWSGGMVRTL
jgi:hypothetical protein